MSMGNWWNETDRVKEGAERKACSGALRPPQTPHRQVSEGA